MFKQELLFQVARFVVVGGTVTLAFMGLNRWFGRRLGKNGAFFAAYPPAVALHFCLNKWWTFGSNGTTTPQQASHYLLLMLGAFVIQWTVFQLLTRYTQMRAWVASGAATGAQMIIAFLVMRVWIFAASRGG